jgi:hypothetical protein
MCVFTFHVYIPNNLNTLYNSNQLIHAFMPVPSSISLSLGIELLDQMHVSLFISNRDVYLKNIIHIWYQIGTYVSVVWPAETNRSASIFGRNTDLLHRHIPTYLGIKQTDNLILPLDAKNLCRGGSGLIIAGLSQAWASYFGLGLFAGMKNLLNKSGSSRAQDLLSK